MADIRATQGFILSVLGPDNSASLNITQGVVLALYNHHAEDIRTTTGYVLSVLGSKPELKVTQAHVKVLWVGRRENRKLRIWPASLDGHDFVHIRLGDSATLMYDLTTGQWSRYEGHDLPFWRAHLGLNWQGIGPKTLNTGSTWNIIGGDDDQGILWRVDSSYKLDTDTDGEEVPFTRQVQGMYPMRMREGEQCGAVYVIGSLANPALTGDQITLKTSDDNGNTWVDHGPITINAGDHTQEISWIGLGLMTSPGRLFLLEDFGALHRVSSLDMRNGPA